MLKITKSPDFKVSVISGLILITAYILTCQFYAMWWFILALADLLFSLYYFCVIIRCVIFWIGYSKKYTYAYVPFFITLTAIGILFCLPSLNSGKRYHKGSFSLRQAKVSHCLCSLYEDIYCVYGGGAWSTDLNAVYLTDFKNFREYIGTYSEGDEQIHFECKGDLIETTKTTKVGIDRRWSDPTALDQKLFSIKALIEKGSFQ